MKNIYNLFNTNILKKFNIHDKLFLNNIYKCIHLSNKNSKKIKINYFKKSNITLTNSQLKVINDSTIFFPDNISKFIIKNKTTNYAVYNFNINNRIYTLNVYCYNKYNFDNNDLKFIINWFVLLDKMAPKNCSNNIQLYILLTDFKKKLPDEENTMISPTNVNSAFTYGCRDNNKIVIFREEEWKKVLIHETFHTFNLDFHNNDFTELKKAIKNLFQLESKFLIFETYCETFATLWFCAFQAYELSEKTSHKLFINYIETLLSYEQQFFAFQSSRILNHFNCSYINLKNNQCTNYKENTNVFCYFILKSICFIHINEFIGLCQKHFKNDNIVNINFNNKCEEDFIYFFEKYAFHDKTLNMMNYMNIIARKNNGKSLKMMLST